MAKKVRDLRKAYENQQKLNRALKKELAAQKPEPVEHPLLDMGFAVDPALLKADEKKK